MMVAHPVISSYLLVDAALADLDDWPPLPLDAAAMWLAPVYEGAAAWAGPVLIDILAAEAAGALDHAMAMANAIRPQLHTSLINTPLCFKEITAHLRRFVYIRNHRQQALSLRYADCLVLAALPAVLSDAQWAALAGPATRWRIHQRDGSLCDLAPADPAVIASTTPLVMTEQQVLHLSETFLPDRMIGYLRAVNHGTLPGNYAEQHRWASAAHALWRASGSNDELVLRWVTEALFETRGAALEDAQLAEMLSEGSLEAIRAGLRIVAMRCASNRNG